MSVSTTLNSALELSEWGLSGGRGSGCGGHHFAPSALGTDKISKDMEAFEFLSLLHQWVLRRYDMWLCFSSQCDKAFRV